MITIATATIAELPEFSRLFDLYRQFYGGSTDLPAARAFLAERFARQDAILLGATLGGSPAQQLVGFVQLYTIPDSLGGGRLMILNDLFVEPAARRAGVARALMCAAQDHARAHGVGRLELSTQVGNQVGQRLYESLGWQSDSGFRHYVLTMPVTQ